MREKARQDKTKTQKKLRRPSAAVCVRHIFYMPLCACVCSPANWAAMLLPTGGWGAWQVANLGQFVFVVNRSSLTRGCVFEWSQEPTFVLCNSSVRPDRVRSLDDLVMCWATRFIHSHHSHHANRTNRSSPPPPAARRGLSALGHQGSQAVRVRSDIGRRDDASCGCGRNRGKAACNFIHQDALIVVRGMVQVLELHWCLYCAYPANTNQATGQKSFIPQAQQFAPPSWKVGPVLKLVI